MITKKELKAKAVAERKRSVFHAKVRRLIGHAYYIATLDRDEANKAYDAGTTADAFAAIVAAREPVGLVVQPLKLDAIKHAHDQGVKMLATMRAKLVAAGWNVNAVAPYPTRDMGVWEWQAAYHRHNRYARCTRWGDTKHEDERAGIRYVTWFKQGADDEIARMEKAAAEQYDAFIVKLVGKVGPVVTAHLEGSHVWAESILTVTKTQTDGVHHPAITQRWRTHQIENRSKLGLWFPQWPTILMKGKV